MRTDRESSTLGTKKQFAENNEPLITIGVPTYDRRELLRQCVASILSQSYTNIEVIIGNDCIDQPLTFDSLGIQEDPRVRIINHAENLGAYNNHYYLLREATGDWFTWLADDDLMHPEFLQIAYDVFSKYNVNSVYTNYVAKPDPYGCFPKKVTSVAPQIFSGSEFIEEYSSRRIKTVGNYGVFRRELFKKLGDVKRFGTGLPVYVDTFMPILAASLGVLAYVDLELIFLRTHTSSNSASADCIEAYSSAQKDFLVEFNQCCREYSGTPDYQRQLVNMLKWFAADGWHVIGRRHPGLYQRISGFCRYTRETIVPILPARSRVAFWAYTIKMIIGDSMRYLASRFLRRLNVGTKR